MEKFEIINNKWIKTIQLGNTFSSLKIKEINKIEVEISCIDVYYIILGVDSSLGIRFKYDKKEMDQFDVDLKILEDLLYN